MWVTLSKMKSLMLSNFPALMQQCQQGVWGILPPYCRGLLKVKKATTFVTLTQVCIVAASTLISWIGVGLKSAIQGM